MNLLSKPELRKGDGIVEVISTLALTGSTQLFILFLSVGLCTPLVPDMEGAIADWHFLVIFGLFVVFDDMI